MEYKGNLYGKIFNKYFPTGKTAADYDELEQKVKLLEEENNKLKNRIDQLENK